MALSIADQVFAPQLTIQKIAVNLYVNAYNPCQIDQKPIEEYMPMKLSINVTARRNF